MKEGVGGQGQGQVRAWSSRGRVRGGGVHLDSKSCT